MDQEILVREQIDAGERFLLEFQDLLSIESAFWIVGSQAETPMLYIVLSEVKHGDLDAAYGEVLNVSHRLKDPNFDPFLVKLVGPEDPLAQAASNVLQKYGGLTATHFNGYQFGGESVQKVFIYPTPHGTART